MTMTPKTHKKRLKGLRLMTAGAGLGVLLASCTPGPAYVRPAINTPTHYKESVATSAGPWQPAKPDDAARRGQWWRMFDDQTLDMLEVKVDSGNQNIKKSLADLEQAKAMVGTARSSYFPTIGASVDASRSHTSTNVVGRSLAGKTVNDFAGGLTASWEPDLFDRVGHQVDSAQALYQASQADLVSVRLSMHAELAIDYVDLRELDLEASLLAKTVTNDTRAMTMVKTRFEGGIAAESDVAQAESSLDIAKAQLIDVGEYRAIHEHAIAMLIGKPPADFSLVPNNKTLDLPVVPPGVPSTLLERRPDVAAAERRVAASNADVGEATSAFFPDLMLSATGGLESTGLSQWVDLPSRLWTLGPALIGTLFDGGRRHSTLVAAKAGQDAAAADYRQIALGAFQEVEDNLATLNVLARESVVQQLAVDASGRAARLAVTRYQDGATDYLEVVTTENVNLNQSLSLIDLSRRRLAADVSLIKALGGKWDVDVR